MLTIPVSLCCFNKRVEMGYVGNNFIIGLKRVMQVAPLLNELARVEFSTF